MSFPADNASILVVDDEPVCLRLTAEVLRKHGLDVVCANNGTEGLSIATRLRPDVILLDICMPDLDGFEVCRHLKASPATCEVPVIFLTTMDQIDDKARGFEVGGVDYITKPFDPRELLLRVTNHQRLARRIAQLQDQYNTRGLEVGPPALLAPPRPLAILLKARDLLIADLIAPPDIASLARDCGTNRTSLQRLFREHLGLSITGYLREQRLQRARQLLEQVHHSVESVADAVGYHNGRDLARAFKRRFGVTPRSVHHTI